MPVPGLDMQQDKVDSGEVKFNQPKPEVKVREMDNATSGRHLSLIDA